MAEIITGTLTCHKYANWRHTKSFLADALMDIIKPLPHSEIWAIWIEPDAEHPRKRLFKMRSGKLPACLAREQDGQQVTVRATVTYFNNSLGGYISRVTVHHG